jgi:hypothetical protein
VKEISTPKSTPKNICDDKAPEKRILKLLSPHSPTARPLLLTYGYKLSDDLMQQVFHNTFTMDERFFPEKWLFTKVVSYFPPYPR